MDRVKTMNHKVFANLAHGSQNIQTIAGAVPDAVKVENDRVGIGVFKESFDLVIGGGERNPKLPGKMFAEFAEQFREVCD